MSDINITEFSQKAKCNKNLALVGVLFALLLSCGLICLELCKYNPQETIVAKTIVTEEQNGKPVSDTACCMLSHKVGSTPAKVTETDYDNSANIILYISILAFMILSLWGAFAILLKALKSEHEINSKILDTKLGIYKEEDMWKLTMQKKDFDIKLEKDTDLGRKYRELEIKKMDAEYRQNLKDNSGKEKCQEQSSSESK